MEGKKEEFGEATKAKAFPRFPLHCLNARKTIAAKCCRLARDYEDRGAPIAIKALKFSSDPAEVLADIERAIETGDDLGYALSHHWKEEWKSWR
jgi:hypothetical protein